jgi:membrane-bound serine protease (ClpP class)
MKFFNPLLILSAVLALTNATSFGKSATAWLEVEIGIIGTSSEDVLNSALQDAGTQGYAGLIVVIDTPGGSLEATRNMVKSILNAEFPVVVWVGPNGSRAASAGAFITLAAHIAAMAPTSNIGAAQPIKADGSNLDESDAAKKVQNDTVAFIESIAKARNRNIEMARSFVLASASITAQEALDNKVIDLIVADIAELLKGINGKTVTLESGNTVLLNTANVTVDKYRKTLKQEFLEILSNPNLFYLLYIAGLIGLGFELTHPGALFPGVIGGICMVLALIATSVLPINFGAMVLVAAGVALLIAEIFLPSFGIVGIGGFAAFIIGSFLLVDPDNVEGLRISVFTIAPAAVFLLISMLAIARLIFRARNAGVKAGAEAMLGSEGEVMKDFKNGKGRIFIFGEDWQATTNEQEPTALIKGDRVLVTAIKGLTLVVTPKK